MQRMGIVFQMSVLEACNNWGHTHTRLHGTQTNDDNETQVALRETCKRALALEDKGSSKTCLTEKSAVSEPHPIPVYREV